MVRFVPESNVAGPAYWHDVIYVSSRNKLVFSGALHAQRMLEKEALAILAPAVIVPASSG